MGHGCLVEGPTGNDVGKLGRRNLTKLKQFRHISGKWSGSMAACILLSEDFEKKDTRRHERFNHQPENDSRSD